MSTKTDSMTANKIESHFYVGEGVKMTMDSESKPHMWEMETAWFVPPNSENTSQTFAYKSWHDFLECKPYRFWKPYVLSSWCWKEGMFQIVFISPERFVGMNRVEMRVKQEDEPEIRQWIQNHMPKFWKL
jgi:hypothetical protein